MTIAIVGAMAEEVAWMESRLKERRSFVAANTRFFTGRLNGHDVVLVQSGIGKANAAMSTTILLERFKMELVVNIGAAGALDPELAVGDIVIAEELTYSDVDATVFGYAYGQVPQMPASYPVDKELVSLALRAASPETRKERVVTGLLTTEDSFIGRPELASAIRTQLPQSKASDMEGAAIAQVAYQYGVPFLSIRAISDNVGADAADLFKSNLDLAAQNSSTVAEALVELYHATRVG